MTSGGDQAASTLPVTAEQLREVLALTRDGDVLLGEVRDGWDVYGTPHGGYLAAMAANAVLVDSGAPDLFTVSLHYLRAAAVGPIRFSVERTGGSRRFTSWRVTAVQDDTPIITGVALVGDRDDVRGPTWTDATPRVAAEDDLTAPAGQGSPDGGPRWPEIAARFGQQTDRTTVTFDAGRPAQAARVRTRLATDEPDQLAALIACDLTAPAVWNVVGPGGWIPTLELTAHVRAHPAPGPLHVEVQTHHLTDGLAEEDALVHDATGHLIVQSRQLALVRPTD